MIGDTPFDAQAATGCGVKAVGVLTGGFEDHELQAAGCSAVLPSLRHLQNCGRLTWQRAVQAAVNPPARRVTEGTLRQIPRWR
jgi:hypothetical protein